MLTRKGVDVTDRISSLLPSSEKIPFYIPNLDQSFDEKSEMSVIEIVSKFQWKHLVVVSDDLAVIQSFNKRAAEENRRRSTWRDISKWICIVRNIYIRRSR